MTAISCRNLSLQTKGDTSGRPGRRILTDVSFDVVPGELVAIVGSSGAGKSSLLACLAGIDSPTSGIVRLLGSDLSRMSRTKLAAFRLRHVSLVMQGDSLFSALSCLENVALPQRLRRSRGTRLRREGALAALATTGMAWAADSLPKALSGGERQRVAVARMLATPADLVLVDEPTASLDAANAAAVFRMLRERADDGAAVVMVTHDLDAAAEADRVVVLSAGSLLCDESRPRTDALRRWIGEPAGVPATEPSVAR